MRRMVASACLACLGACTSADEPLPPTPQQTAFAPAEACIEPPQPPPEAVLYGSEGRACVPGRYVQGLPLELTVSRGKVVALRFYSQCEGRVYDVEPKVRDCIQKAVDSWSFDYLAPMCAGTTSRGDEVQTTHLYIMPLPRNVHGKELASGIGSGCSAL